jgi:hypothetical protein
MSEKGKLDAPLFTILRAGTAKGPRAAAAVVNMAYTVKAQPSERLQSARGG